MLTGPSRRWRCVPANGVSVANATAKAKAFGRKVRKGLCEGRKGKLDGDGEGVAGFLVFVLELVELVVEAAVGEELLVGALFAEASLVHDEDGIGALDGGEAMGDDDTGSAGDHAGEGGFDAQLGFGVDGAGGFVED